MEVDPAEADALHALLVEPGQPGLVASAVVGGRGRGATRGAGVGALVLQPQLDVGRRVEHLALDDEGVAPRVQPSRQPVLPPPVPDDHPARQDLAPAVVGEVGGSSPDDVLDDAVTGQAGVAVDQPFAAGRGDHERWVRGDEVEALPRDRCEQRAVAHLDPVGDLVEGRVEAGQPQRARVDVGGDHAPGVPRQVQRLHPAAGAEVERGADGVPQGELGQRRRRGTDPEHVVGGHPVREAVETRGEVADHPPGLVVAGVGADVEAGGHLADGAGQQPRRHQRVEEPGQGPLGLAHPHDRLEQEEPGQRLDRRPGPGREQAGRGLVAGQRRVGAPSQERGHRGVGETRAEQGLAEPGSEVVGLRGRGGHPRHPAGRTSAAPGREDRGRRVVRWRVGLRGC